MKNLFFIIILCVFTLGYGQQNQANQEDKAVKGIVINTENNLPLSNVHVLNLTQVIGGITDQEGVFEIKAAVNDTLYFSFIGFKPIKVRVTNDILKFEGTRIGLTELAYALEEVVVKPYELTGYLEIDVKNIPVNNAFRYSISGLNTGYEAGNPRRISRVLKAIFDPATTLNNIFSKKSKQLRKLKQMKQDDEIRNLLASKFDRETLSALIQVDKDNIQEILGNCNYSKEFIQTANDLQILDAISGCYEEYKVLNREN